MKRSTNLYCFSPPVMLATIVIEVAFTVYVIWRYNMNTSARLVVLILSCLAIFQGTEFLLCGGLSISGGTWSQVGYSAITLLPPLGIHLAYALAKQTSRYIVPAAYASAACFIGLFILSMGAISGHECYANYAVFDLNMNVTWLAYGSYYYGWLLVGVALSFIFAIRSKKNIRASLVSLGSGYALFMIPTTIVNLLSPETVSGIPSIMCGFAVILAFILTLKTMPLTGVQGSKKLLSLQFFRLRS